MIWHQVFRVLFGIPDLTIHGCPGVPNPFWDVDDIEWECA